MIENIDTSLIDWSRVPICPYGHVSLALRATNTRTWRYPSYYGDDLLSDR